MSGLDNNQWEIVNRHFNIALEVCKEAGLSEEEATDEFANVLDNVYGDDRPYVPGEPKPKKS